MQAIILCGGKGTRLSSLYADRPKVLVPILNRPFVEWQLDWLARGGVTDVHLAAGYKAEALQRWRRNAFTLTLSTEPAPLGTAGGLKFVEPWIRSDPFLLINGDTLLPNLDLAALAAIDGRTTGPLGVIAVTRIEESGRYGTVEFADNKRIIAFREKTSRAEGWINGGVYLLRKAMLGQITPGANLSLETDIFPSLAKQASLSVFPCPPPLLDMGTPDGIQAMEAFLKPGG